MKKKASKVFSEEEKAAMVDRAAEVKGDKGTGETALLAKIAEMQAPDRAMADRIHSAIKAGAPELEPTLWYGMPAYARRKGKVVCFFQPAAKFKTRYATLGFNDPAHLDDGSMWPVAYAIQAITPAEEARIRALVKKAAG